MQRILFSLFWAWRALVGVAFTLNLSSINHTERQIEQTNDLESLLRIRGEIRKKASIAMIAARWSLAALLIPPLLSFFISINLQGGVFLMGWLLLCSGAYGYFLHCWHQGVELAEICFDKTNVLYPLRHSQRC